MKRFEESVVPDTHGLGRDMDGRADPLDIEETEKDIVLVARCRRGDTQAYTALYSRHADRVYRACHAWLGDRDEAEDATQATFTYAFAKLATFRGDSKLSTWLYGIAFRVAANARRGRRRRMRLAALFGMSAAADARSPEHRAGARQTLDRLAATLAKLNDKMRAAFVLHHVEELSITETAAALGVSVLTAFARAKAAHAEVCLLLGHSADQGDER